MAIAKRILAGYFMSKDRAIVPFSVTGLTGSDEQRAIQIFTADGLPHIDLKDKDKKGDPHPFRPELICTDLQIVRVDGLDTALINAIYEYDEDADGADEEQQGPFGGIQSLTFNTQIYSVETEFDHDRFPIVVRYNYASQDPANPGDCGAAVANNGPAPDPNLPAPDSSGPLVQCQVGKVSSFATIGILKVTRREQGFPLKTGMDIAGKTNIEPWLGEGEDAWLSAGSTIVSTDKGKNSIVSYEFHLNTAGWLRTAAYIIPETGRPPVLNAKPFPVKINTRPALQITGNHEYKNGYTMVRVQGRWLFQSLGLPDFSGKIT